MKDKAGQSCIDEKGYNYKKLRCWKGKVRSRVSLCQTRTDDIVDVACVNIVTWSVGVKGWEN